MTRALLACAAVVLPATVLPAAALGATVSVVDGTLRYRAEPGEANRIRIKEVRTPDQFIVVEQIFGLGGTVSHTPGSGCRAEGQTIRCEIAGVERINAKLGDKEDAIQLVREDAFVFNGEGSLPSKIDLGSGGGIEVTGLPPHDIRGGSKADEIIGSGGYEISGGGGKDTISTGAGGDEITGGDGKDTIKGGADKDTIKGGNGNDTIRGGNGADKLEGGDGNDSLRGQSGDDSAKGEGGNDSVRGGDGEDKLEGNTGSDFLDGDGGRDKLDCGFLGNDVGVAQSIDEVVGCETVRRP